MQTPPELRKCALFVNGYLAGNTELGELQLPDSRGTADQYASARTRSHCGMDLTEWTLRVNEMLAEFCRLLSPSVIILGGAISIRWPEFGD